jgi:hypothetical protein
MEDGNTPKVTLRELLRQASAEKDSAKLRALMTQIKDALERGEKLEGPEQS